MTIDITLKLFSFRRRICIHRQWIQYGVIASVVILSVAAAFWGSMKILMLLLAAVGGLAILLILLSSHHLGFLLILVSGMFIPFSGPGGLNASVLTIILLMAVWMMDMFVVKRRFDFVQSRALRPVAYFMVVSILAFGMGQIPWFVFANQAPLETQLGGFGIYFFLLGSMIMTANLVRDTHWLQVLVWAFVGLGILYVIGDALRLSVFDQIYRPAFTAHSMFWLWLVVLPLGQAIFNNHLSQRVRVLLFGIVALSLYAAMISRSDWKSGWVPAVVATATLFGLRFKRLVFLSIPFVMVFLVYVVQKLISTDLYSWGTRLDAWIVVLNISRTSPILGLGFANYLWYAPLFPIRGWYIRFSSHSQFVDIIAQTGILGLGCFLWLLFETGRLAWNLMRDLPEGFEKGYAYSIFASVLGSIMAAFLVDWLLPFAYNIGLDGVRASVLPWIFWGGLISIEQMHRKRLQANAADLVNNTDK